MLGRPEEAQAAMTELLAVNPKLRISTLRNRIPIVKDEDFNRFADALRPAGLPE